MIEFTIAQATACSLLLYYWMKFQILLDACTEDKRIALGEVEARHQDILQLEDDIKVLYSSNKINVNYNNNQKALYGITMIVCIIVIISE